MLPEIIEMGDLIFKPFRALSEKEKLELGKSWANPFNARFNGMKNPYSSVIDIAQRKEPTFTNILDYNDAMYFRVVYDKKTEELVGSCRFGVYNTREEKDIRADVWDFGFNIILKHWSKGYGVKILSAICELSKKQGAKVIRGGASNDNFGSYRAMIKNGFKYDDYDDDRDFQFIRDLSLPMPSAAEIEREWCAHIQRYKDRPDEEDSTFGEEKYKRLKKIDDIIKEMVERIQAGEDEDKLVAEYFEICNAIVEFPEKSVEVK